MTKRRTMSDFAEIIDAYLKRLQADKKGVNRNKLLNKETRKWEYTDDPMQGHSAYFNAGAFVSGSRVHLVEISYQGGTKITRTEAEATVEWIEAGETVTEDNETGSPRRFVYLLRDREKNAERQRTRERGKNWWRIETHTPRGAKGRNIDVEGVLITKTEAGMLLKLIAHEEGAPEPATYDLDLSQGESLRMIAALQSIVFGVEGESVRIDPDNEFERRRTW